MSSTNRQTATDQLAEEIYQYLNEYYGYDVDIDELSNLINSNMGEILEQLNERE